MRSVRNNRECHETVCVICDSNLDFECGGEGAWVHVSGRNVDVFVVVQAIRIPARQQFVVDRDLQANLQWKNQNKSKNIHTVYLFKGTYT